jgi:hypothetical protein
MDWISVAQNKHQWWVLVIMVMKFQFSLNAAQMVAS